MKKTRKFTSMLITAACTASFCFGTSYAEDTSSQLTYGDYIYYQKNDDNGDGINDSITITDCENSAEVIEIPAEIESLPVTVIGKSAFEYCSSLTSITIPDTVTTIGESAFSDTSMSGIVIPDSVTVIDKFAFYNCRNLSNVIISKNLKVLEQQAFSYCDSLKSLELPYGLEVIGISQFFNTPIEEINIPETVKEIGEHAFDDTPWLEKYFEDNQFIIFNDTLYKARDYEEHITIPEGIKTIGRLAFEENKNMTGITIPDSVTKIGASAFVDCTALKNITIPETVTELGYNTFDSCSSLESVYFENQSYTTLPARLFYSCTSLREVNLPDTLTSIPEKMFSGCISLTEFDFPKNVTKIEMNAFYRCSSLESITIPESVTSIGAQAFEMCRALKNISIAPSIKDIGQDAFYYTAWIEDQKSKSDFVVVNGILIDGSAASGDFTIPEGVEVIGTGAFYGKVGAKRINNVTVPEYVKEIKCAFYSSTLNNIIIENPNCIICDGISTFSNGLGYKTTEGNYWINYKGVIYCHENSTAHQYALKYNRSYSIIGSDVVVEAPEAPKKSGTAAIGILVIPTTSTTVSPSVTTSTNAVDTSETSAQIMMGDANCDNTVSATDITAIAKCIASDALYPLKNSSAYANADMNDSGKVDSDDLSIIIEQYTNGQL